MIFKLKIDNYIFDAVIFAIIEANGSKMIQLCNNLILTFGPNCLKISRMAKGFCLPIPGDIL